MSEFQTLHAGMAGTIDVGGDPNGQPPRLRRHAYHR